MPAVSISPVFNETAYQNADGLPLVGGKIFTYLAGSFTDLRLSYSDSSGSVANQNPVVLDSSGRPNTVIWLMDGTSYNMVLTQPDGTTVISSDDNITGV